MLSAAKWHEQIPKDRTANLKMRLAVLRRCKGDPAAQRAMIEMCRQDLLAYINLFVWQFNPKKKGLAAVGPFITWGFQEEALRTILDCYDRNRSAVVEKSREMGATWLFLIVQDWLCLFHPYVQTLNISRNADAVDCKSPNSLFWKLRFMHRHLPDWLRGKTTPQDMYFHFERTDSVITGEASTGRAGVGGRAGLIFVDEFSKIKEAKEVRQRTANTADCRFFNSTHDGSDTEFFQLTQTPEFTKIVMHWTQHPEKWPGAYRYDPKKNQIEVLDKSFVYPEDFQFVYSESPLGGPFPGIRSPWYDRKCVEIGSPRGVAVELDIDVGGSVSQFFDPLTLRLLTETYACPPYWRGDIRYDKESGRPLDLIPTPDGPLLLWCHLRRDGSVPPGKYGAGLDVGTGMGATNSCLTITDAQTGEKVLEYAVAHVPAEALAPIVSALAWLFKTDEGEPALVAWEHCGPGALFGDRFYKLGYPRCYERDSGYLQVGGRTARGNTRILGWYPSEDAKRLLLEEYRAALSMREFVNRSALALEECKAYHYVPGGKVAHPKDSPRSDPTGARVNHGDRVIADALSWKMCKTFGIVGRRKEEVEGVPVGSLAWRRELREKVESEEREW